MVKTDIISAIAAVQDWKGKNIEYKTVDGGVTNPNYKVTVDGEAFFLKIPGEGTDFIDRDNAHVINKIASDTGVGPQACYYDPETGVEIVKWLDGYRTLTFGDVYDEAIFVKIAETARNFHAGTEKAPLVESVFDQNREMVARASEGRYLPPWHDKMLYLMDKIEESFNAFGIELKPCHNDFWSNNLMINDETGDMKLIDYEYGSMGDPFYDLGIYSGVNFLTEDMDVILNKVYADGDENSFARLKLNKIASDIKWSYWSLMNAMISELTDYMNWYGPKVARLQHMWADPRVDIWMNQLKGRSPFYTK